MRLPILCSLAAALALTGGASAQSCRPVYHAPYVAPAVKVVKDVVPVIQKFVAVVPLVELPTYSAYYTPPVVPVAPVTPAPTAEPAKPNELSQILAAVQGIHGKIDSVDRKVQDLDARLRAVEGRAPPQPPPGPAVKPPDRPDPFAPKAGALSAPRPAALDVFQAKCASCHEAKASAEKGGGFTLLEGAALAKLDDRQARKVLSLAYSGRMPPKSSGHTLTDEEVGTIAALVDTLK